MDTEKLKNDLKEVQSLVDAGVISSEDGLLWKERLVSEFKATNIPAERNRELPNDLAHLPGRLVGGFIEALGAIARGSGATYEGLSKQEGYMDKNGKPIRQNQKSVVELYNDLPPQYK